MTVRLLCAYGGNQPGAIVNLDPGTEAGLIASKQAESNLAGGTAVPPAVPVPKAGAVPYILAQSAVPVIILPAGTVNGSGQFTLGTALNYVPSGVVLVYVFAGIGLVAGLYPATFSSTTVCQLVGNLATINGAYAGGISEVNLSSPVVPAGAIGPNGKIKAEAWWSSNNTDTKSALIKFAGQTIVSNSFGSLFTTIGLRQFAEIANRGAQNVNVYNSSVGWGAVPVGFTQSLIDTSVPQVITFSAVLTSASDWLILDSYTVEVIPGA